MTAVFLLGLSIGVAISAITFVSMTTGRIFELNGYPESRLKETDLITLENWKSNSLTTGAFFILTSLILLGIVIFA